MAKSSKTFGPLALPGYEPAIPMLPDSLRPYSDVLHRVALTVNSSLELKQILTQLGNIALEAIPADRCHLFLLDESGTKLVPTFSIGRVTDMALWRRFKKMQPIDLKEVPARWEAFSAGRVLAIADVASSHLIPPEVVKVFGSRSALIAKLEANGDPLGVFTLDWVVRRQEFDYEEIQLVETICAYAALAIRNARLYDTLQNKARSLERLVHVAGALNSTLSLKSVLEMICDGFEELMPTTHLSVNLIDRQAEHWLRTLAVRGVPWFISEPTIFETVSKREIRRVSNLWVRSPEPEPVVYHDADQLTVVDRSLIPAQIKSGALFPLHTSGELIGFVVAAFPKVGGPGVEALEAGQALAEQAATAIGRAQLHEKLRQRLQKVEVLSRLSDVVAGTSGLTLAVRRLNQFLRPELGIRLRSISISNPQLREMVEARTPDREENEAIRSWRSSLAKSRTAPVPKEVPGGLLVPIVHGNRVQGALRITHEGPELPERELLSAIAAGCSEVIYKAGLRRDLAEIERRLAIAAERDRIARDLHDSVGQILHGMGLRLAQYLPDAPDDEWRQRLEELHSQADRGNRMVRESIRALLFLDVRRKGLSKSLRDLAAKFEASTGIDVSVKLDGEPITIPPDYEEALFRVVHESLINVERHSRASFVIVSLTYRNGDISIKVRDDGTGLSHRDPFAVKGPHFGLRGLQRLVEQIGGALQVKNASPRGVIVEARVSVPRNGRYRKRADAADSSS